MASTLGFRRVLVPIAANPESEKAMDVACRVARVGSGVVSVLAVVEVPTTLPLDSRMDDAELDAHRLLERAAAVADSYGVRVSTRSLRARAAASGILAEASRGSYEIVIAGAPRKRPSSRGTLAFGPTIEHVLKRAPCRVMLIGAAPIEVYAVTRPSFSAGRLGSRGCAPTSAASTRSCRGTSGSSRLAGSPTCSATASSGRS